MRHCLRIFLLLAMTLQATGCAQDALFDSALVQQPKIAQSTQSSRILAALPPPAAPVVVAAYHFDDETGQLKPNTQFAEYSRAVTQGGLNILDKALLTASGGQWFTVLERGGLKDVLEERQIINTMRSMYSLPNGQKLGKLPPLLYAGMLIEGSIIGYDANVVTGGAGANYLGIGGNVSHQRDIVTVGLRAVNITNGQILLSVNSEKTVYSIGVQGNVFKYVSLDHLLEAETGFTMNEPPELAVREAIETAVYELIMEGARRGLWHFADPQAGSAAMTTYLKRLATDSRYVPQPSPPSSSNATFSTQLPTSSTESSPPDAARSEAEKAAIVGQPHKFLSFGDGSTTTPPPAGDTPLQYPPVPLAPKKADPK